MQELDGSSPPNPTANLLIGLDIDERFTRTDSSGTADFLTDNLGSVVGLASSSGSLITDYTYEPFGNLVAGGSGNANSYQFTGRENDGTGLYFYRARYYSPTFQRFVAQDPLEFEGDGPNVYAYALNDPVDSLDPLGLKIKPACKGDCPDNPPNSIPDWQPDKNDGLIARLIRQHLTHPGQTCFETIIDGKYLHCCYDRSGHPIYSNRGSAWEDYPPSSFGHYWETGRWIFGL